VQAIDWKSLPETTSPAFHHRLKHEILGLRDGGLVLIRLAELKQRMEMTLARIPSWRSWRRWWERVLGGEAAG